MNINPLYPTLSENEFDEQVLQNREAPVLVVFTADWLGAGTILDEMMERLSIKYIGKMEFYRMDIERSHSILSKFNIRQFPAVITFKQGEIIDYFTGMLPERLIEERLTLFL